MPIFSYKGMDRSGKEIKNTINIESIVSAKAKIKSMGIMLIDIKEQKAQGTSGGSSFLRMGGSVGVEDLAMMTRQLATLIKAKIQIVESLAALVDQVENVTLRLVLADLRQKVNEGEVYASQAVSNDDDVELLLIVRFNVAVFTQAATFNDVNV